ncbi:hypothetical protein KIK06_14835 [Nocardiopsis sp. EMB25]|uniref:hypothetical protein n=1 Tax=Nocardiopsis sp. EMB25 TaxID=2835867 RepID=UPI002283C851|nr:hypothetical protein [Nocardiopsis sp. EMB25]MCY9785158.1 hypothetical protein [Nocardiopsis sp. EMB25]
MGELLTEFGKKLAERWLSLLVLPGALYLAAAATALILGHTWNVGPLREKITAYAQSPIASSFGGQAVLLATLLAGAAAVGLVAQALGTLVERAALATDWHAWRRPLSNLADWWVTKRQGRWDEKDSTHRNELDRARDPWPEARPDRLARRRAARDRDRIAVERPERPSWSGDRIHAVAIRLDHDYHLDLALVWPFLWLVLPNRVRDQVVEARTALSRASTLAGWSLLYLPLAFLSWPTALLAIVIAATARYRLRAATDTYARLLEAAARLYTVSLAAQLGIDHDGLPTPRLGDVLTQHLRTQLPPPPEQG